MRIKMEEIKKSNEKGKKVVRKRVKVTKKNTNKNTEKTAENKPTVVKNQIIKKQNNLPKIGGKENKLPKVTKKENLIPTVNKKDDLTPTVIRKKNKSIINLGLEENPIAIKEDFMFKKENLKIIPLGGIEEIGKNITVFEYGNDIVIVDCGVAFPEEDMLGIDLVIPDFSYLEKNKEKIRGLVITHGHEDHIGSIAYLLKQMNIPIFATKLTCGLIQNKLLEHHLDKVA